MEFFEIVVKVYDKNNKEQNIYIKTLLSLEQSLEEKACLEHKNPDISFEIERYAMTDEDINGVHWYESAAS